MSASLERKRDLMAALPPGDGWNTILKAIDELIAEYRAALKSGIQP